MPGVNKFAQTVAAMPTSVNVEDLRPIVDVSRNGWAAMGNARAFGSPDDAALSPDFRNTLPPTQREIDEYYAQFEQPKAPPYRAR